MSLIYFLTRRAKKRLARLGKKQQKQIANVLSELQQQGFLHGTKQIKIGTGKEYSHRVGNHRIIFTLVDDVMVIEDIKPRDEKTYKK